MALPKIRCTWPLGAKNRYELKPSTKHTQKTPVIGQPHTFTVFAGLGPGPVYTASSTVLAVLLYWLRGESDCPVL